MRGGKSYDFSQFDMWQRLPAFAEKDVAMQFNPTVEVTEA